MGFFQEFLQGYTPAGSMFNPHDTRDIVQQKKAEEARIKYGDVQSRTLDQRLASSYFKGLKGLSAEDRAQWEQKYSKYIQGKTEEEIDEIFRSTVFKSYLTSSDRQEDKLMLEKYNSDDGITIEERDNYFARLAMDNDLDGESNFIESNPSFSDRTNLHALYEKTNTPQSERIGITTTHSLRDQAVDALSKQGNKLYDKELELLRNDNTGQALKQQTIFNEQLREMFPYFEEYEGKLDLSYDEYNQLLARFKADVQTGGGSFAYRNLNKQITNILGEKQGVIEKIGNTAAQFGDSAAGMIIRAAGMAMGAVGAVGDDEDSYWNNIIDNSWTRYGDRVATTHSWKKSEQEFLEENGLSDNPILGTFDQQRSIVSWNTPFEVLGQYGFTVASTILTLGGAGIVNLGFKGLGYLSKAGTAGKALNTAAKATKFVQRMSKAKDVLNTMVAGAVGTVEGGMNASQTYNQAIKKYNNTANDYKYTAATQEYADQLFNQAKSGNLANQQIINGLLQIGLINEQSTAEEIQYAVQQYKTNPEISKAIANELFTNDKYKEYADKWINDFAPHINQQYETILQEGKSAAERAMYTDFGINSAINGMMNVTLKAALNAAPVRNSINRTMGRKPKWADDIDIVYNNGKAVANPKKHTRLNEFWNRSKAALGEGVEEYTQEISSKFSTGLADSKIEQYYNYLAGDGTDIFVEDLSQTLSRGLMEAEEAAFAKESIKSFIYGALSTFIGGPGVNNQFSPGARQEGEAWYQYAKRNSPVGWNSALGAFMPGATDAENQRRQKMADTFNSFFENPELQSWLLDAGASTEQMAKLDRSLREGNEKDARDARAELAIKAIQNLNDTEGSSYYDAIMEALNQRVSFAPEDLDDPNSAASKAVAEYRQTIGNVKQSEEKTDKQILERIKKQAQNLLDLKQKISDYTDEYRSIIGENADQDAVNALVFEQLTVDNVESRMKSLDQNIAKTERIIREKAKDYQSGESSAPQIVRQVVAEHGSIENLDSRLQESKREVAELEDKLQVQQDNAKKLSGKVRHTLLNTIKRTKQQLKEAKQERAELTKQHKELYDVLGKDDTTSKDLTLADILELNARQKASLFSMYEKGLPISEKTKKAIEEYRKYALRENSYSFQEVIDRGIIEAKAEQGIQTIYEVLSDPKNYSIYAYVKKLEAKDKLLAGKYKYLQTLEDYDQFALDLQNAEKLGEGRAAHIQARSNPLYERYRIETVQNKETIDKYSNASKKLSPKLNSDAQKVFDSLLEILVKNGINVEDSNAIAQYIKDNYNTITQELPNIEGISNAAENLISVFNDAMSQIKQILQREQDLSEVPEVKTESTEEKQPPVKTPEQRISEAKNRIKNLHETLSYMVNGIQSSTDNSKLTAEHWELIATICEEQLAASKADTSLLKTNIWNALLKAKNEKGLPLNMGEKSVLESWYGSSIQGLLDKLGNKREKKSNPNWTGSIGVLDIFGLPDDKFKTLKDYFTKHNMAEVLVNIAAQQNKPTVYYIVDQELFNKTKEDLGANFSIDNIPVVAVIETNKDTGIQIDGKYYQPIGVMPASNSMYTGANNMTAIREGLPIENVTESFIIKDKDGKPFASDIQSIEFSQTENIDNSPIVISAKEQNLEQLDALETSSWRTNFFSQSWYQNARKEFISRIKHRVQNSMPLFFYTINTRKEGVLNAILIKRRSIAETKSTILEGRPTLVEVFNDTEWENKLQRFNPIIAKIYTELCSNGIKTKTEKNKTLDETIKNQINNILEGIYFPGNISVQINTENKTFDVFLTNKDKDGNITSSLILIEGVSYTEDQVTLDNNQFKWILQSILFNGKEAKQENFAERIHWQLSRDWFYGKDGKGEQGSPMVESRLQELYDSDVFIINSNSLQMQARELLLSNPTLPKSNIKPAPPAPSSTAGTAAPNSPINEVPSTPPTPSAPLAPQTPEAKNRIEKALQRLHEMHQRIMDRRGTQEGTLSTPVTTLGNEIEFDKEIIGATGNNVANPEKVAYPVGNVMDALVRDIFDNKIYTRNNSTGYWFKNSEGILIKAEEVYPNIQLNHLNRIVKQIIDYKTYAENNLGLTFISQEYFIEGVLDITTSENVKGQVKFHGIPDLIAYDREGNFHIYDIKTMRIMQSEGIQQIAQSRSNSYAPQISLYATAIEQNLGVKVVRTGILPIIVQYDDALVNNVRHASNPFNPDAHPELGNNRKPKVLELFSGTKSVQSIRYGLVRSTTANQNDLIFEVQRVDMSKLGSELSERTQAALVLEVNNAAGIKANDPNNYTEDEKKQDVEVKSINMIDQSSIDDDIDDLSFDFGEGYMSGSSAGINHSTVMDDSLKYDNQSEKLRESLKEDYGDSAEQVWNSLSKEEKENMKKCRS